MQINFECQKCKIIFNSDVGSISLNEKTFRPDFTNTIMCPNCGERTIDEVFLTELGQSQLTSATMKL